MNKASIRYNFGNKADFVIAVLDSYIHDECRGLVATEGRAAGRTW